MEKLGCNSSDWEEMTVGNKKKGLQNDEYTEG